MARSDYRLVVKTENGEHKIWVLRDEPYAVAMPVLLQFIPFSDGEKLPDRPTLTVGVCDDEYRKLVARSFAEDVNQ